MWHCDVVVMSTSQLHSTKPELRFCTILLAVCQRFINNAEDLDINTLMYNLLDCSNNYSITGNLWNFYRDKVNDDENENNVPGDYGIISNKIATSRSIQ